jgi:hypothetical protein
MTEKSGYYNGADFVNSLRRASLVYARLFVAGDRARAGSDEAMALMFSSKPWGLDAFVVKSPSAEPGFLAEKSAG